MVSAHADMASVLVPSRLTADDGDKARANWLHKHIASAHATGLRCCACATAFRDEPARYPHTLPSNCAGQPEAPLSEPGDAVQIADDGEWFLAATALRCSGCATLVHAGCVGATYQDIIVGDKHGGWMCAFCSEAVTPAAGLTSNSAAPSEGEALRIPPCTFCGQGHEFKFKAAAAQLSDPSTTSAALQTQAEAAPAFCKVACSSSVPSADAGGEIVASTGQWAHYACLLWGAAGNIIDLQSVQCRDSPMQGDSKTAARQHHAVQYFAPPSNLKALAPQREQWLHAFTEHTGITTLDCGRPSGLVPAPMLASRALYVESWRAPATAVGPPLPLALPHGLKALTLAHTPGVAGGLQALRLHLGASRDSCGMGRAFHPLAAPTPLYSSCLEGYSGERFMIGCDDCGEWFFASDVGVAKGQVAEAYSCPWCIVRGPPPPAVPQYAEMKGTEEDEPYPPASPGRELLVPVVRFLADADSWEEAEGVEGGVLPDDARSYCPAIAVPLYMKALGDWARMVREQAPQLVELGTPPRSHAHSHRQDGPSWSVAWVLEGEYQSLYDPCGAGTPWRPVAMEAAARAGMHAQLGRLLQEASVDDEAVTRSAQQWFLEHHPSIVFNAPSSADVPLGNGISHCGVNRGTVTWPLGVLLAADGAVAALSQVVADVVAGRSDTHASLAQLLCLAPGLRGAAVWLRGVLTATPLSPPPVTLGAVERCVHWAHWLQGVQEVIKGGTTDATAAQVLLRLRGLSNGVPDGLPAPPSDQSGGGSVLAMKVVSKLNKAHALVGQWLAAHSNTLAAAQPAPASPPAAAAAPPSTPSGGPSHGGASASLSQLQECMDSLPGMLRGCSDVVAAESTLALLGGALRAAVPALASILGTPTHPLLTPLKALQLPDMSATPSTAVSSSECFEALASLASAVQRNPGILLPPATASALLPPAEDAHWTHTAQRMLEGRGAPSISRPSLAAVHTHVNNREGVQGRSDAWARGAGGGVTPLSIALALYGEGEGGQGLPHPRVAGAMSSLQQAAAQAQAAQGVAGSSLQAALACAASISKEEIEPQQVVACMQQAQAHLETSQAALDASPLTLPLELEVTVTNALRCASHQAALLLSSAGGTLAKAKAVRSQLQAALGEVQGGTGDMSAVATSVLSQLEQAVQAASAAQGAVRKLCSTLPTLPLPLPAASAGALLAGPQAVDILLDSAAVSEALTMAQSCTLSLGDDLSALQAWHRGAEGVSRLAGGLLGGAMQPPLDPLTQLQACVDIMEAGAELVAWCDGADRAGLKLDSGRVDALRVLLDATRGGLGVVQGALIGGLVLTQSEPALASSSVSALSLPSGASWPGLVLCIAPPDGTPTAAAAAPQTEAMCTAVQGVGAMQPPSPPNGIALTGGLGAVCAAVCRVASLLHALALAEEALQPAKGGVPQVSVLHLEQAMSALQRLQEGHGDCLRPVAAAIQQRLAAAAQAQQHLSAALQGPQWSNEALEAALRNIMVEENGTHTVFPVDFPGFKQLRTALSMLQWSGSVCSEARHPAALWNTWRDSISPEHCNTALAEAVDFPALAALWRAMSAVQRHVSAVADALLCADTVVQQHGAALRSGRQSGGRRGAASAHKSTDAVPADAVVQLLRSCVLLQGTLPEGGGLVDAFVVSALVGTPSNAVDAPVFSAVARAAAAATAALRGGPLLVPALGDAGGGEPCELPDDIAAVVACGMQHLEQCSEWMESARDAILGALAVEQAEVRVAAQVGGGSASRSAKQDIKALHAALGQLKHVQGGASVQALEPPAGLLRTLSLVHARLLLLDDVRSAVIQAAEQRIDGLYLMHTTQAVVTSGAGMHTPPAQGEGGVFPAMDTLSTALLQWRAGEIDLQKWLSEEEAGAPPLMRDLRGVLCSMATQSRILLSGLLPEPEHNLAVLKDVFSSAHGQGRALLRGPVKPPGLAASTELVQRLLAGVTSTSSGALGHWVVRCQAALAALQADVRKVQLQLVEEAEGGAPTASTLQAAVSAAPVGIAVDGWHTGVITGQLCLPVALEAGVGHCLVQSASATPEWAWGVPSVLHSEPLKALGGSKAAGSIAVPLPPAGMAALVLGAALSAGSLVWARLGLMPWWPATLLGAVRGGQGGVTSDPQGLLSDAAAASALAAAVAAAHNGEQGGSVPQQQLLWATAPPHAQRDRGDAEETHTAPLCTYDTWVAVRLWGAALDSAALSDAGMGAGAWFDRTLEPDAFMVKGGSEMEGQWQGSGTQGQPALYAWVPCSAVAAWGAPPLALAWAAEIRDGVLRNAVEKSVKAPPPKSGTGGVPYPVLKARRARTLNRLARSRKTRATALGLRVAPEGGAGGSRKRKRSKSSRFAGYVDDLLPWNSSVEDVCSALLSAQHPAGAAVHASLSQRDPSYAAAVEAAVNSLRVAALASAEAYPPPCVQEVAWADWLAASVRHGMPVPLKLVQGGEGGLRAAAMAELDLSDSEDDQAQQQDSDSSGAEDGATSEEEADAAYEAALPNVGGGSKGGKGGKRRRKGGAGPAVPTDSDSDDSLYGDTPLASLADAPTGGGALPASVPNIGTGASRLQQLVAWQRKSALRSSKKRTAVVAGPAVDAASSGVARSPKGGEGGSNTPSSAQQSSGAPERSRAKVPDAVIRRKARLMIAGALLHAKVPDAALSLAADAAASPVAGCSLTAVRLALAVAGDAEAAMHQLAPLSTARQSYRQQLLAITSNLNDSSNPGLRKRVLSGSIKGAQLGVMSSQDMASRERKAERTALVEEEVQRANKTAMAEESKARPDEHATQPGMHLGSAAVAPSGGAHSDEGGGAAPGSADVFGKKHNASAPKSSVLTQLVSREGGEGGVSDEAAAAEAAAAEALAAAAERGAATAALKGLQVLSRPMQCTMKLQAPPKGVPDTIKVKVQHAKWAGAPADSVAAAVGAAFGEGGAGGASLFTDVRSRWGLGDVVDNGAAAKLRLAQFPTDVLQAGRMKLPALATYLLEVHSKMRLSSRVAGALHLRANGEGMGPLCRSLAAAQRALVLEVAPGTQPEHPKGDWQWYILPPLTHLASGADGSSVSLARASALPADVRGMYWMLMSGYAAGPGDALAVLVMRKPKPPKSATRTSSSHSKSVFGSRPSTKRAPPPEWSPPSPAAAPAAKGARTGEAAVDNHGPYTSVQHSASQPPSGVFGGSASSSAPPNAYDPYAPPPHASGGGGPDPYSAPPTTVPTTTSQHDPYASTPTAGATSAPPTVATAAASGVSRLAGLAAALAAIPGGAPPPTAPSAPLGAFGQHGVYTQPTSAAMSGGGSLLGAPPPPAGGAFGRGALPSRPGPAIGGGRFPGATTPAWAMKGQQGNK